MSETAFLCRQILCLAIFVGCASSPAAWAVWMRPLSLAELTTNAHAVVHGKVFSKTVARDSAGQILTTVELDVLESIKGASKQGRILIVQQGGVLGDEVTTVSGQEHYEIGEEVVVFLVFDNRGRGVTLGLAQGKFQVKEDKESKELVAQNPFHGKSAKSGKPLKLATLKQQVKGATP